MTQIIDYNSTERTIIRFVQGGGTVTWASLQLPNHAFNNLNIGRIMWSGTPWTVVNGTGQVVLDTSTSLTGVFDFEDRGHLITVASNSSFTVTSGNTGIFILELVKSA